MILNNSSNKDAALEKNLHSLLKRSMLILNKNNIHQIPIEIGEEFDEAKHNAVSTIDTDEYESGCIITVLKNGYSLNEKILRYTLVVVSN